MITAALQRRIKPRLVQLHTNTHSSAAPPRSPPAAGRFPRFPKLQETSGNLRQLQESCISTKRSWKSSSFIPERQSRGSDKQLQQMFPSLWSFCQSKEAQQWQKYSVRRERGSHSIWQELIIDWTGIAYWSIRLSWVCGQLHTSPHLTSVSRGYAHVGPYLPELPAHLSTCSECMLAQLDFLSRSPLIM